MEMHGSIRLAFFLVLLRYQAIFDVLDLCGRGFTKMLSRNGKLDCEGRLLTLQPSPTCLGDFELEKRLRSNLKPSLIFQHVRCSRSSFFDPALRDAFSVVCQPSWFSVVQGQDRFFHT